MEEVGRKVVASSEIHILGSDKKHDGVIGIVIKKHFREGQYMDEVVGTKLIE
jgi:hypothetical protein